MRGLKGSGTQEGPKEERCKKAEVLMMEIDSNWVLQTYTEHTHTNENRNYAWRPSNSKA